MNYIRQFFRTDRIILSWSLVCLLISFSLLGIKQQNVTAAAAEDEEFLRFVDVAAEVYREIKGKYVDEVESRKVLESALVGMFNSLDDHSQFMTPRQLDSLTKDTGGNFSGIGIHITERQGLLTVIAPMPGSPSAEVGIMPWDRIIEIEGETTEGMTLQDAVERLTGPSGTQVSIKVFREGESEPLDFTITRAQIKIDSVYYRMMEDNIGYIRIARFSENTTKDLRKALLDLKAQDMKAILLDLRFNTGGLLREAIEVSNLFVEKHSLIVSTKGRLRSQNREYRATADSLVRLPMFVLVNEGSASASEIVAGALQDHKVAVVIGPEGKNTFGKGSVQTIEPLRSTLYDDDKGNPRQAAMRLTTARYYTPSGRTIHEVGVTPDVGIALPENHERELLRAGLYGDTTIPLTAEERKAIEDAEKEGDIEPLEESETPAETPNIVEQDTPNEQPAAPFYSRARRPDIVENKVVDILLEEAHKKMKAHMLLKDGEPQIADVGGNTVSLAP